MPDFDLKFMATLATAYAGEPVKVIEDYVPLALGEVTWEDGLLIKLHPVLHGPERTNLLSIFLHEVGHIKCGHVYRKNVVKYDTIETYSRMKHVPLDTLKTWAKKRENEAWEWAKKEEARLETEHPGFGSLLVMGG